MMYVEQIPKGQGIPAPEQIKGTLRRTLPGKDWVDKVEVDRENRIVKVHIHSHIIITKETDQLIKDKIQEAITG